MTAGVVCKFIVHSSTSFSTTRFCAPIRNSNNWFWLCHFQVCPNLIVRLCSSDQPSPPFAAYALSIEPKHCCRKTLPCFIEKNKSIMTHLTNQATTTLPRSSQPPLSYPGATPDSDRARKPPLAEPTATGEELSPGDRVEGLGDFGIPTGELGTVEQTNEEDAVVKWDDDGRKRLHQPWLKKV